jgi:hypothetical protein
MQFLLLRLGDTAGVVRCVGLLGVCDCVVGCVAIFGGVNDELPMLYK